MQTICVEIPDSFGEVLILPRREFYIISKKENLDKSNDLIICTKSDFLIEIDKQVDDKFKKLLKENEKLKKEIDKLKQRDYKNRALKASLTRANKVINILTK